MKIDARAPLLLVFVLGAAVPACSEDRFFPLAFLTDRDGNFEIYLLSGEDEPPVNVTYNPASDYGFSWSPDGSRFAFGTDRDGNREVYVCDADGGNQTNLTQDPAGDRQPFIDMIAPDCRITISAIDQQGLAGAIAPFDERGVD